MVREGHRFAIFTISSPYHHKQIATVAKHERESEPNQRENSKTAIIYILNAKTHLVQRECQTLTHAAEGRGPQAMDGQPRCRNSLHTKQNKMELYFWSANVTAGQGQQLNMFLF